MAIQRITEKQDGLITAEQCRRLGLTTDQVKALVRAGLWRPVRRGVYLVDADLRGDLDQRAELRAAVLACGPQAVLTLYSAAELHGLPRLRADGRVHVCLPGHLSKPKLLHDSQIVPHQVMLRAHEITAVDGIPVTSVLRTIADLILVVDRLSGVALLDAALFGGFVTERELARLPRLLKGRRGAVLAREMLELADGRAESPPESRARLRHGGATADPPAGPCGAGRLPVDDQELRHIDTPSNITISS